MGRPEESHNKSEESYIIMNYNPSLEREFDANIKRKLSQKELGYENKVIFITCIEPSSQVVKSISSMIFLPKLDINIANLPEKTILSYIWKTNLKI